SRRPRHAWLQPLLEARGLRALRCRPARRRHPRPHRRTRCRVRAVGRSRLGRKHRLDDRDEPPRGGRPTRHPQRGPSAAAVAGPAQPEPAPEVLVLLLLCGTGTARGGGARQRLALLPTLPAGREPALHRPGNRTLRRGVVASERRSSDSVKRMRFGQCQRAGPVRTIGARLPVRRGEGERERWTQTRVSYPTKVVADAAETSASALYRVRSVRMTFTGTR